MTDLSDLAAAPSSGLAGYDDVLAWVGAVSAEDRDGWSGAARTDRVSELSLLAERVQAALIGAVADCDRDRAWAYDGAASAESWLAHSTALDRREAARVVAAARLVNDHARVRDGLVTRAVTTAHVALLARAARDREDVFRRDVDVLVDAAGHLEHEQFRSVVRRWCVLADDVAVGPGHDAGPLRWLHASVTWAGHVRVDGLLDPEGGAVLLAALAANTRPPSRDDARTPAERRADALVSALGGDHVPVRLDVLADAETLIGRPPTDLERTCHDLAGIGPVPPSLIRRLACDATISHAARDASGALVDIGRATRAIPPRLRRALELRDQGCTWPGCDRPAGWTDAHHVHPVASGGTTVLENLRLLCRHHHRLVHQGREPTEPPPPMPP